MEIAPPLNRIDQQLAEIDHLLKALIFISENVEPWQLELLSHSTIAICYCAHDKIAAANRDISLLQHA